MYPNSTSFLTSKKGLLMGALFVLLNVTFSFSQNCNATLSVEKNRNVKSVYKNGATYTMVLTNNSSQTAVYNLSSTILKESCATENRKTSVPNVALNVAFRSSSKTSYNLNGNSITLKGGETKTFQVFLTIPERTPYNSWSCIEIDAKATGCNGPAASTVLRVFVPEPSEG